MTLALIVVITIASIVACHRMALRRGRNPVRWGALGLLFGPLAVLALLLATPASKGDQ